MTQVCPNCGHSELSRCSRINLACCQTASTAVNKPADRAAVTEPTRSATREASSATVSLTGLGIQIERQFTVQGRLANAVHRHKSADGPSDLLVATRPVAFCPDGKSFVLRSASLSVIKHDRSSVIFVAGSSRALQSIFVV